MRASSLVPQATSVRPPRSFQRKIRGQLRPWFITNGQIWPTTPQNGIHGSFRRLKHFLNNPATEINPMNSKLKLIAYALLTLTAGAASAATLPSGFSESVVATGVSSPTAMAFAPDGRLFVCQQNGQLRVLKNDRLLATPFLTVTTDSTGERGLLGVAFDPDFANNQLVYIYYAVPGSPPHNRVSRFTASGDLAVPGSEAVVLELNDLSTANNHNGGAIHFGLDGELYVAVGENANSANSQTLANLLGKMLRIHAN